MTFLLHISAVEIVGKKNFFIVISIQFSWQRIRNTLLELTLWIIYNFVEAV